MGEAIKRTLHEQMAEDERIRVFGEDVADAREAVLANVEGKGGVFGTTFGLQRRFGLARCYNTPLAEANIVGRAVGQGFGGYGPCPKSSSLTTSGLPCTRSKVRRPPSAGVPTGRSTARWCCVWPSAATSAGGPSGTPSRVSRSSPTFPGLTVVMPSRAADAVGLLRTALQAEDPVLFLEHKHLLRQPYTRDPYPSRDFQIPFGRGGWRATATK